MDSPEHRVFVSQLPYHIRWLELKSFMRQAGPVARADVIVRADGLSRGLGVVEYEDADSARNAIEKLNGRKLDGRRIVVTEYRRPQKTPSGSGASEKQQAVDDAAEQEGDNDSASAGADEQEDEDDGENDCDSENGDGSEESSGDGSDGIDEGSRDDEDSQNATRQNLIGRLTQYPPELCVFVDFLPYDTTWSELKHYFSQAGPVVRAKIHRSFSGRSKGHGTVMFESPEYARDAITLFNHTQFGGRRIVVREDVPFEQRRERTASARHAAGAFAGATRESPRPRLRTMFAGATRESSRPRMRAMFAASAGDLAAASSHGSAGDTLHIANLPWSLTDNKLKALCDEAAPTAPVVRAQLQRLGDGRFAGSAVVQYGSADDAAKALAQLDGRVFDRRPLAATYARFIPE